MSDLNKLNSSELGSVLRLSERQIKRLVDAGMPSAGIGKKRRFNAGESVEWYLQRKLGEREEAKPRGDEEWARTLTEQQTRKTKVDAERSEIKLAKERREVVAIEEVKQAQMKVNAIIRNRLLGVPTKVAPLVTGKSMQQTKAVLESEIREVLTQLSESDGATS